LHSIAGVSPGLVAGIAAGAGMGKGGIRARAARAGLTSGRLGRFSAAIIWQGPPLPHLETAMDRAETSARIADLIEPFNKKGIAISDDITFAGDLEWDSLTVMDFVAAIEDEFDIIISMNQQAEIETYGQLIDAVTSLRG